MFDVILFTDAPEFATRTRGYGVHRLATHIRERGYTCLVIDFISALSFDYYEKIINHAVGDNTIMVGISLTWMPFRYTLMDGSDTIGMHDPGREIEKDGVDEHISGQTDLFHDKFSSAIVRNQVESWFELIRNKNQNTKIVLGGTKIGMYLDIQMIDYFFVGYSETMIMDFLDSMSGKSPQRIWNKIIDYDQKAQTPVWDFRVSKTRYTEWDFIQPQEPLSLEVGRGCRFKCKFCSYPLIGQKNINDYLKYCEVLEDELRQNYELWGTTRYFIVDDTFNDSTEKMQMFLNVVNRLPFDISFWCYLRLDLLAAHPEQIPMLKEMGMSQCYFGIETFDKEAGKSIGKGANADKLKETLYYCKKIWGNKVNIQAGFIVGLPKEDSQSVFDTAEWLAQDDCPIDIKWIIPLSIAAGNNQVLRYMHRSEFDLNAEKYGYNIPDMQKFWEWTKDDGTDIDSSQKAEEVALKAELLYKNLPYKGDLYLASLPHPILSNRELTIEMTDEEYMQLVDSIDQPSLYVASVTKDYFEPLISKLEKEIFILSDEF